MRLFQGTPWDQPPPQCQRCGQLESDCQCPPQAVAKFVQKDPTQQTARLAVERRKRGKQVIVIRGLASAHNDLANVLSQIKSECGVGGTWKGDLLEIQGGQIERVREALTRMGYRCR